MASLFTKPDPLPAPSSAVPAPSYEDRMAAQAAEEERRRNSNRGRASTILTGVEDQPTPRRALGD